MKKAIIITFGCRLNIADSALLTARLERAGFEVVEECSAPDMILVNSCAVTAEAASKCRRKVRQLRREFPQTRIAVTGCAAQLAPKEFQAAGADEVFANPGKKSFPAGTEDDNPVFHERVCSRFPFRSRAFIKIQEGCNNFCTYCIVPYVRGRERSRAEEEVLTECKEAIVAGFPELVLTGVNTCAYNAGGTGLGELIGKIAAMPGDFRLRLSSTEPHPDNRSLVDVMASEPKVCRFLHLSLQYGSNRLLKAMNRHYTREEFAEFVSYAREKLPGVHIGTDLIAGFPGETEEDFLDCCDFVRQMQFANTHIFTYSPRPGTPAATMANQVDPETAARRRNAFQQIADESARSFAHSQCGMELPVIFERDDGKHVRGWSDNYLEVLLPSKAAPVGIICKVKAAQENLTRLNGITAD